MTHNRICLHRAEGNASSRRRYVRDTLAALPWRLASAI
jgi:hypothetical protein